MLETDLFWTITTIVSVVIEWIVLKIILDELSKLKSSKIVSNTMLLIASIIITILTIIEINPNIKLCLCISMTYIFYRFNYNINSTKSIFVSSLYWMMIIGFDAIGSSIAVILNSIKNMNELLANNVLRLELIILSKSLLLSLIPFIKAIKLKIEIKLSECLYVTIPIIANIISISVIFEFIFKDKNININESILILIVSSVLFLSNIALINIISRVIKDNNLRIDNKVIREKMEIQYKYYLNLQKSQSKTRKLYHDMNNHIICIQNIYGKDNNVDKYIEDISNQLKDCNSIFSTNSVILDVILNEKKSVCDKNNIEFIADINFSECNFIDMPDICSIFSNMLDNAIEACNKISETNMSKIIKIRGTVINTFFVIKCQNTKTNDINFKTNKILTDKKDSFLHGIGINSIKNSVEKYNGNVEIDSYENKFIMTIYIPLIKNCDQLCM